GWNFHGVFWNVETLLAAAELAEWQMSRWPVPAVTRWLGNSDTDRDQRLSIAATAIKAVWGRSISEFAKQAFVFAVLSGIGSLREANRLCDAIRGLFGPDLLSAQQILNCVAVWIQHPTGGVVRP